MRALSAEPRPAATKTVRPDGRATDQLVGSVLTDIAYTLWPEFTAPSLAAVVKCEVRTAERYLGGQREWSGDAIAAVVAEIMRRHGERNVKVVSRLPGETRPPALSAVAGHGRK